MGYGAVYACAGVSTTGAVEQAPARITAATPAYPQALSAADFAAILAETHGVVSHQPPDGTLMLPKAWKRLTRDKLAALLTMPSSKTCRWTSASC